MKITENPFYLLGATPRDNRQKIQDLVDEKMLELDSTVCAEARQTLTNPRKRLSAEIAWFPGVSIRQINTIIIELENGKLTETVMDNLSPLAGFNTLLFFLSSGVRLTQKILEHYIFALAQNYDVINADRVLKIINEDRIVSGFPEIIDLSVVQDEVLNLKDNAIQQLQITLGVLSIQSLNKLMLDLMERAIKSDAPLMLLDELIDKVYVIAVQRDLDSIQGKLTETMKSIRDSLGKKRGANSTTEKMLDQFLSELEEFDNLMQPIQLSTQRRGLEHEVSKKIAQEATTLALDLVDQSDDFKLTEKVLKKIKELFVEVNSVNQETSDILSLIDKRRAEDKKWEQSITYSYTKTSFWGGKTTLSLNTKQIVFGEQSCNTSDVQAIKYGKTKRYYNGIYQGTDTFVLIDYGAEYDIVIDNWLDVSEFDKFTDCLWKAVGPRIIMAMVDQLALGNHIYGIVFDDKVRLVKNHTFLPSEDKFFKWKDVRITTLLGVCVISGSDGYSVSFTIQDTNNGLPLAILLTQFKERGGTRISETFKVSKQDAKQRKNKSIDFSAQMDIYDTSFIWHWVFVILGIIGLFALVIAN